VSDVINAASPTRALAERLEALRAAPGFRNYQVVRERVLDMRARVDADPHYVPSAYWKEELANFEYMLDASPLIIDKLRHHSFHITGLKLHDYRSGQSRKRARFAAKLQALLGQGRPELFVPEAETLGGYGYDIDGHLVNLDTLKFFEVFLALDKGAVLDEFREGRERKLVWEVGAGWGGFPYQFKTLCPNTTYLISDFPELFLFSATYLMTLFPGARVRFWGEEPADRIFANWRDYDFIFTPNTALADLSPDQLDLVVNMVSFQEMTSAQVTSYVARAHELGARFLYSLNRERSGMNDELDSVTRIVSEYFWPREVSLLKVPYQKMLDEAPSQNDYKHLVGWKRIRTKQRE
jgi:putative sugar O-methyltransferase